MLLKNVPKKRLGEILIEEGYLSARELEVINQVLNRLSDMNAAQISEYSHKDVPWMTTEDGQKIEYESVFYRTPEYSVRESGESIQ